MIDRTASTYPQGIVLDGATSRYKEMIDTLFIYIVQIHTYIYLGKHVMCDKPTSLDADEAHKMFRAALVCNLYYRYWHFILINLTKI